MHSPHSHPYQKGLGLALLALAAPLVWWLSQPTRALVIGHNTLVFIHTAVEVFVVVVAMLIFVTGYRAILSARKGAVILLGVSFLGVGLLDFLHLMSDVGMPDALTPNTPQKSIFFWLTARLLAASALFFYAILPAISSVAPFKRRLAVVVMLVMVGSLGGIGLLWSDRIPVLFIPGQGFSPLKISLEWLVVLIHIGTLGVLWHRRVVLAQECVMALGFAVALSALSELFLARLGIIDNDAANVIGHIYNVAAYLFLFHATSNEALQRPLERLNAQHLREKQVLSSAPDGVLWVNDTGLILMANPAMTKLTGYTVDELVGQNVAMFLPPHLRARHADQMRGYFTAPDARAMGLLELKLLRRDGQFLPIDISLGHLEDDGTHHAIAYIRDLSERKRFEESLRYQATHDELTGLPNRWLFHLQLRQALARAERTAHHVAIMFLDLDNFKNINDGFGHATGDTLLVQVSQRMRSVLREKDTLARLGGDEFAILLAELNDIEEAASVANKLLTTLQTVYRIGENEMYSSASVGLAFYPDDAKSSETLLRYADLAMYQAKANGRGVFALYSSGMDKEVHENMQLHARLKEAMTQGALQLHYQPQVDVFSGTIVGAEALLRWHDPVQGQVSPARFIPVAESTGLILPLSEWVLETACSQISTWMQAGTPLRVAVNISAQQFRQHDLAAKVHAALKNTGAQAQWLDIEITESVAMTQPDQARAQLNALAALGCRVALDDFGTGYSSLAYLKSLPVHKLKIDKSFMDGVLNEGSDASITRAIIALAQSLGMDLVAEGVETDAQRVFLQTHGCHTYQGWLFARAMTASDLTQLLPVPAVN